MDTSTQTSAQIEISPEAIAKIGNEFYLSSLKDILEKSNFGEYVVIEVLSKEYFVDKDLKNALETAQSKYPDKLFHIIKIGSLQKLAREKSYAWLF